MDRDEAKKMIRDKAEKVESNRINKLLLQELPGGGFLVRALREIGERLSKLEEVLEIKK